MPNYTYDAGLVFNAETMEIATDAAGTVAATPGGDALQVFDLNGMPLASLKTNTLGYLPAFATTSPTAYLDFGTGIQRVISIEAQESGLQAAAAQAAAEAAQAAAETAATAAASSTPTPGVLDPVVAESVRDETSATRAALDPIYGRARPTYVSRTKGVFDPVRGVYGFSQATASWRTRLLAARTMKRPTAITIMGSSTVAGYGSPGLDTWGVQLRNLLEGAGFPIRGTGIVYPGSGKSVNDPRWTFSTSGVTAVLNRMAANVASGAWAEYTSELPGSVVRIYYAQWGGNFTYSIDGGAPVAVTTNGGLGIGTVEVTGLSSTTHKVRVTGTATSAAYFIGCEVLKASNGLSVTVAGVGGTTTEHWKNGTTFDNYNHARLRVPALTIYAMGGNDCTLGVPVETMKENFRKMLTSDRTNNSGSLLVVMPHASAPTLDEYLVYVDALYELADEFEVPLVDMCYRWGDLATATAANLMSDASHPNAAGHLDYARTVFSALGVA